MNSIRFKQINTIYPARIVDIIHELRISIYGDVAKIVESYHISSDALKYIESFQNKKVRISGVLEEYYDDVWMLTVCLNIHTLPSLHYICKSNNDIMYNDKNTCKLANYSSHQLYKYGFGIHNIIGVMYDIKNNDILERKRNKERQEEKKFFEINGRPKEDYDYAEEQYKEECNWYMGDTHNTEEYREENWEMNNDDHKDNYDIYYGHCEERELYNYADKKIYNVFYEYLDQQCKECGINTDCCGHFDELIPSIGAIYYIYHDIQCDKCSDVCKGHFSIHYDSDKLKQNMRGFKQMIKRYKYSFFLKM
jgi:hypothetical protein